MHADEMTYPPPEFPAPDVPGERYEAVVPDTLDLAERAAMAISGIAGGIDQDLDHQMWFLINYALQSCDHAPSRRRRNLRRAVGPNPRAPAHDERSTAHIATEVGLMEHLLRDTSPEDGLYYNVFRPDKPWHSEYGHSHRALINEDFAVTVAQAHLLEAMIFWRELSGDPAWETRIRKMVDGLTISPSTKMTTPTTRTAVLPRCAANPRSGWRHTMSRRTITTMRKAP